MAALHTNDLSFVKGPPEEIEIECPICLQVMLDDPHLVLCCGHHFCGPCIKRVKHHRNQPCPYCKEKEFQAVPDKGRLRYINGLQVNCTNEGCGWKKELKSLPSHINREKREGECQFEVVKCKYDECEVKQQRQHLKIHEEEKCDQRPYDCQYCRHKGTYQYITQQHYPQCTLYPVPCPNKCHGKFPCGDIEGHLSTVCPLQPVECEFKWAGCHYSPLRKDLPQHNIESQLNHMSLLAKSCRESNSTCQELKRDNEELKVVCQELKRDNEELKRDNEELKKDNEELKVVCRELKRDNEELKRDNEELKKDNEELKVVCRELKRDNEELKRDNEELKKDNEELKVVCRELKRDNEELKKDNEELKKDNEELKKDNEELKRDNEELKVACQKLKVMYQELKRDNNDMKQQLVNVHHAVVGDHRPLLPVTVSCRDKGFRYFYSKPCGHLMSIEVSFSTYGNAYILIKEHKGKFQLPPVSEIVIKYRDDQYETVTRIMTKNNCKSYKAYDRSNYGDVIQRFQISSPSDDDVEIININ